MASGIMAVYGLVSCFPPKELIGPALADLVAHSCMCVLLGTSGGTVPVYEDPERPEVPQWPKRFLCDFLSLSVSAQVQPEYSSGATSQRLSSKPRIHPHSAKGVNTP